jgi:ESS family glutamate:Na+ symporter
MLALLLRQTHLLALDLDTTLQTPLMVAFFTSIGLGASFRLLKKGGVQVLVFWGLAGSVAMLQNGLGIALAKVLHLDPLLGMIGGSITMSGGHGTGAAFGKMFEERYHITGATTLAMAAATFGLVSGSVIGGPIGTWVVRRHGLAPATKGPPPAPTGLEHAALDEEIDTEPAGEAATAFTLLKNLTIILVTMSAGAIVSAWLDRYVTLPGYVGAMICAAVIRNTADATKIVEVEQRTVDDLGTIALALFLSMALMSLKLWELLDLALPMLVILVGQVTLVGAFAAFITYRAMGRDYDAAVMSAGHCGFALGATPNAVANMTSLTDRFGTAPRAFLVLPMVGAFFIDFTNALIITAFLNVVR